MGSRYILLRGCRTINKHDSEENLALSYPNVLRPRRDSLRAGRRYQTSRDIWTENLLPGGWLRTGSNSAARLRGRQRQLEDDPARAGRQVPRVRTGPDWFRTIRQAADQLSRSHAGGLPQCFL